MTGIELTDSVMNMKRKGVAPAKAEAPFVIPAKAEAPFVIPAKAGIFEFQKQDPRFRGDDKKPWVPAFAGTTPQIKFKPALFSFLFILLSFLASAKAEFFVGPGATGSEFLKIPLSGRAAAMAGAFTAGSGEVGAMEYNPAGLIGLPGTHAELTLLDYIEDASLQSVSLGIPIQLANSRSRLNKSVIAVNYRAFRADDDARNSVGVKLNEFSIRDEVIQVSAAAPLRNSLSIGLTGKFIRREIESESSSNVALDGGVQLRPSRRLSLGASLLNIGSGDEFISEEDPLPLTLRSGAGFHFEKVDAFADVSVGRDQEFRPATGVEWRVHQNVALRSGLLYHETLEFSAGLGVRLSPSGDSSGFRRGFQQKDGWETVGAGGVQFSLDYAAQSRNELGLAHTFSFGILF